jgi:hypothetical protein
MLRRLSSVCVIACLSASAAVAQERIELFTVVDNQPRMVDVDATVRGFGDVLAVTPLTHVPSNGLSSGVAVAGGRYIAWIDQSASRPGVDLFLFDRRTRAVQVRTELLPPPPANARFPSYFRILGSDSHRPRLFVSEFQNPLTTITWTIDLRGGPPVRLISIPSFVDDLAYAAETDELFVLDTNIAVPNTAVVVVNASTGQELRRWIMPGYHTTLLTEPAGRIVWVNIGGLTALDGRTGATLASSVLFSADLAVVDAPRGVLLLRQGDFLVVVDPLRLTEIGRARVAYSPTQNDVYRSIETLPGRWMTGAYVVRAESRNGAATCNAIAVDVLDASGAQRATSDILSRLGPGGDRYCGAHGFLFRSPFAPMALSATVGGGTVALSWRDPGDTTEFELEYGVAPGQRSGAIRLAHTTSVAIPGVPAGTYFVRVKAINEVGASPLSNEVRVVVQ